MEQITRLDERLGTMTIPESVHDQRSTDRFPAVVRSEQEDHFWFEWRSDRQCVNY
jgi:hypothetical protein